MGAESRHQSVRGVRVAAGERPTQGIGHDLACHRPPKIVGPRADQLLPQLLETVDLGAIGQLRLRRDRLLRSLLAKGGPLAVTLPIPHRVVFLKRNTPGIDLAMAAIAGRLIAMDGERLRDRQVLQSRSLAVELRNIGRRGRGRVVEQIPEQPDAALDRMAVLAVGETGENSGVSQDAAAVEALVERAPGAERRGL